MLNNNITICNYENKFETMRSCGLTTRVHKVGPGMVYKKNIQCIIKITGRSCLFGRQLDVMFAHHGLEIGPLQTDLFGSAGHIPVILCEGID